MLGRPSAVVGSSRMVLLPALSDAVSVLVDHVDQEPVDSKETVPVVVPLMMRLAGRAAPLPAPLAKRAPMVAGPAADALTVNWAYAPAAPVPLQKPLPE